MKMCRKKSGRMECVMFKLLNKEYKLTVMPLVYAFFSFVAMLFIPSYPYTVIFFYTTLAIFFCFLSSRENKDLLYMVTLPIPKEDMVKARYGTVVSVEIIQMLLSVPFCIVRCTLLTYENVAGIEANIAFLGLVFVQFAIFNTIFLGMYFKKADNVGIAFLVSSIVEFIVIIVIEASVHIAKAVQGSCFWDQTDRKALIAQIPIFIVGLLFFVIMTFISYQRDVKNFLKQDL